MDEQEILTIEEFMKVASDEQISILYRLAGLAEKEKEMADKINKINGLIERGVYSDNRGVTICEDRDDAMIINSGLVVELSDTRKEIRCLLKKAVNELEMGNVGIIQRQYKNYVID